MEVASSGQAWKASVVLIVKGEEAKKEKEAAALIKTLKPYSEPSKVNPNKILVASHLGFRPI